MAQYTNSSSSYEAIAGGSKGYTPNPGAQKGEDSYVLGWTPGEAPPGLYGKNETPDPLEEPQIKKFYQAMKTYADEHRRPREIIWDDCWRMYNNEFDWSQKAWWQHRASIPKVRSSVDRAVALFRKTLLRMQPFYGIQAESKLGRTKGRFTMLLTDYWFDQSNIVEEMMNAFKVGLITSVAGLKVWWQRTREFKPEVFTEVQEIPTFEYGLQTGSRQLETKSSRLVETYKGKLGVAAVNPRNLWIIPGTHGKGIIERDQCSLNELESLADIGIYDKEAVQRLRNSLAGPTETSKDMTRQNVEGQPSANEYLRMVDLYHFWGDIYNPQGVLVKCDASFTLANEEYLIRKPRDNPFFHKANPYIIGTPYTVPFSTYNRGMVEDISEIAKAITNMANLIADGALYDAMKAFAIDVDQLDDPNEARQGLYPGKTFMRKSGSAAAPNEALVQTIDTGRIPQEAMNMVGLFEKYMQEGSYVNEWVGGFGGKGDRTLGEVNIKTQAALEGLDESARNLEVTTIEPTLQKVAQVIYQFQEDFQLPRLMDNYPQLAMLLQQMSPAERYSIMVGDYSFKVRGLSVMIDRQQKIGELKEILQLLSYLPGFIEQLNPVATLEEVLMPLGWDPAKLLLQPGASGVTLPTAGARPAPPMLMPPMLPGGPGNTPMANRSADDGARFGGSANNPSAGGGPAFRGKTGTLGGGGAGALPPQLAMMLQQIMSRAGGR